MLLCAVCPSAVQTLLALSDLQAKKTHLLASTAAMDTFSPRRLRQALKKAGNIVDPADIHQVLEYAISDQAYQELHGLHLLLLQDGTVHQFLWNTHDKKYLAPIDAESAVVTDLMAQAGSKELLVESGPAWVTMAR